ncbi:signal peptide peptidase SppA [Wenyingzhuangia sp. IMCC45533]
MNFIKRVLSSLVAIWIALIIFIVVGIGIALSFTGDEVKEVTDNSILEINLSGQINDYVPVESNPFSNILGLEEFKYGFNNICKAIEVATYDEKIKGISLTNIPNSMGWAQTTALRKMLVKFKEKGKFIYAYSDVYSQKKYYLSSVADSVFVSPLGRVELKGLHSEVMFYKDFQEKYGVKMEVIRHGKYKSAVEPFIANEMSDANRKQISELINGIWKEIDKAVASTRNIDVEKAVLELYGKSSATALQNNLVDGVLYKNDYQEKLNKRLQTEKDHTVKFKDYMNHVLLKEMEKKESQIAVVYAQGNIMYGKGTLDIIGQKKMIKALSAAAKNDKVKAIVLRVNSPGGDALASDLIWNAVEQAKKKKPVIVSMGNLAASGGYYIACGADRIFAEPTTITGSIGVFGMLPNAAPLAKKIGINAEVVSTHENGVHYSAVLPVDEKFKKVVKEGIEEVYDNFLDRVAKGRNMSMEEVDEVAQGRVWTGVKALEVGLVDELGGLDVAIMYAAKKAEIKEYSLKELPKYDMELKDVLSPGSLIKQQLNVNAIAKDMGIAELSPLKSIFKTRGIQAKLPFEISVY